MTRRVIPTDDNPWALTPSEIRALEATIRYGNYKIVAWNLGISVRTVEMAMRGARRKMRTHTIGCAVTWTKRHSE